MSDLHEIFETEKSCLYRGEKYHVRDNGAIFRCRKENKRKRPLDEKWSVDHIDTNKKNNRPENLRWITRLENILLNPITLSRIIFKYGSIDSFLENPSKP